MANRKDVFRSNKGKREPDWKTNRVGPWRVSHHYNKNDGSRWRLDTRWIGIAIKNKGWFKFAWRSSSEERRVMVRPPRINH